MLTIWGRASSINVQKVLWVCEELGLACERHDLGGEHGGLDDPGYRRRNPHGRVPTVEDDGLVLWESHSIVRYLAARHDPGGLWPADPGERALAERWMDWELGTLWVRFRPLFIALVRTPAAERDAALVERQLAATLEGFRLLDAHMADHEHVALDRLTIADIPLGCALHRWLNLPIETPELPHLRRWYERLAERPAYRAAVMQPVR